MESKETDKNKRMIKQTSTLETKANPEPQNPKVKSPEPERPKSFQALKRPPRRENPKPSSTQEALNPE